MDYSIDKNFKYFKIKYPNFTIESFKKLQLNSSIIISLFSTIASSIYFDIINAVCIGLITLGITYYTILIYPYLVRKTMISSIESELPYFLIDLDIKLGLGIPIHDAIESSAKEYKELNNIFQKVLHQNKIGIPFYKIFLKLSSQYESEDLKRAFNQIIVAYESGYNDRQGPLLDLAEEILNKQKTQIKLYNSKLAMISLLFIAITALIPSLFLIFVTIGSSIIDIGLSSSQVILIITVLFPIIDLVIIMFVSFITPIQIRH